MSRLILAVALAMPVVAQFPGSGETNQQFAAVPSIKTEDANLVLNVPAGKHIMVRSEAGEANVDELPELIEAGLSALQVQLDSEASGLSSSIVAGDDSVSASVQMLESQTQSTIAAAVDAVESSVISTLEGVQSTVTANGQAVNSVTGRLNGVDAAVVCASAGKKYNAADGECYSTNLPEPDFVSSWLSLKAQRGTLGYGEINHGLNVDPERVQVFVRQEDTTNINKFVHFEAMGAGTCDDDGGGCNDYGGTIFAYNNNTVRLWVPDRSNAQTYGTAINIHDGWGANKRDINTRNVEVMVRAWIKYRPTKTPDFDRTMRFSSTNTYQQWTYRADSSNNGIPDRVYVTVEAVDGANRGYKFIGRGASVADDDSGKDFGGLVYGFSKNSVRLWSPHVSNGGIIFNNDGWGGERNVQRSKNGNVRVRVWFEDPEFQPTFKSQKMTMCSNCLRGANRACDGSNPLSYGISFKEIKHNVGKIPNRVSVLSEVGSGNNNGFFFPGISAGGDDEMHQRTGLIFAQTNQEVILWAPTRSNGRYTGRIAGVIDGWGRGAFNFAVECVNVTVTAWV